MGGSGGGRSTTPSTIPRPFPNEFLSSRSGTALASLCAMDATTSMAPLAPIFVLADDDQGALERILERLNSDWFYIPVRNPGLLLKYAKRVEAKAVFLADPVDYPRGGAAFLLQRLIDEVGKPVIVLAEEWSPEIRDRWKKLGADDCLPHPTRFDRRLELLRSKMQALALGSGNNVQASRPGLPQQREGLK